MGPRLERSNRPKQRSAGNVAAAYLALLADRGVDYLFGNAGTDFAPLIEAYAQSAQTGVAVPRPILATHENLAVAMAHGYGMVSRRVPAVMVHVSVGTANMVCAALNAARENVAILLTAGRSPLTETGLLGSRDGYIHWAQEMYDQAGMIREIVKWDYELRNAEQLTTVVDRALAIAATEPRGPVYLSLPREVPWIPSRAAPRPECKVIQCGFDPLFARYPIRGFPCDVAITGSSVATLAALTAALVDALDEQSIALRRRWIKDERDALTAAWKTALDAATRRTPLDPAWVSHCVDRAKEPHCIVINEYTLFLEQCTFESPDVYFGSSSASGLGWGAGAALGAKLARPESPVMAVLGDGAYMFCNPAAVHHASALHELPVLFVIMNNGMWGAVERSTLAMYPDGLAARSNEPPFVALRKLPAFEKICEAAGGHGYRVADPGARPGPLA